MKEESVHQQVTSTRRALSKRGTSLLVLSSSTYVALLQLAPVIILDELHFGYYSIVQLIVVLGSSVSLSLINEADVRRARRGYEQSNWKDFSATLFWLCLTFSVAGFLILRSIDAFSDVALLCSIGVGLAIHRGAVRYRLTQEHCFTRLIFGDVVSISVMLITGYILITSSGSDLSLTDILLFWLAGVVSNTLFTRAPSSLNPARGYRWFRSRFRDIATLLPDSALQDVGAFWSPALIALVLDVQSLGIYRAVTTVAAPIRLILTPLRPLLTNKLTSRKYDVMMYSKLWMISVCIGGLLIAFLIVTDNLNVDLGVISQLLPFAIPAALYVAGNFISYFLSIQGRVQLRSHALITTRVLQALVLGLSPVIFAALTGLSGAIWALAVGSVCLGTVWFVVLRNSTTH